jgi:CRISPR/Cas system CSM-associated protein Csm3 (group 7 of RAMP superfamily)
MPTKRDFFAANALRAVEDIDKLQEASEYDLKPSTKIHLAASGYAQEDLKELKDESRKLYLSLAHNRTGRSRLTHELEAVGKELLDPLLPEARNFLQVTAFDHWPPPWFAIEFFFTLLSPLITRDESGHYPMDNPVRKDTAFTLPVIAATSWKGLLRNAFLFNKVIPAYLAYKKDANADNKNAYLASRWCMLRLFGSEKEPHDEEKAAWPEALKAEQPAQGSHFDDFTLIIRRTFLPSEQVQNDKIPTPNIAGCLYFFSTFFDAVEVEIINPHDSIRRVGTKPIQIEVVPKGSTGLFRLIYQPRISLVRTEEGDVAKTAQADLAQVVQTVKFLFRELGFGAKRTSGFGTAEEKLTKPYGRMIARWQAEAPTVSKSYTTFSELNSLQAGEDKHAK